MTLYKVKSPRTEKRKSLSVFVDSNECKDIKEQGIKMLLSKVKDVDKDKVIVREVVVIDPSKHKGIVFNIASRLKKGLRTIDIEDIISEVNLIIIEKSRKDYDPTYMESTFIMNFIPPIARHNLIKKYVDHIGSIKEGKVRFSFCQTESLNSKREDSEHEFIEFLEDPNHLFIPDEIAEKREVKRVINEAIHTILTPQQLEVLKLRHEFEESDIENSYEAISKKLCISKARAQQIMVECEDILIYKLIDLYEALFE